MYLTYNDNFKLHLCLHFVTLNYCCKDYTFFPSPSPPYKLSINETRKDF